MFAPGSIRDSIVEYLKAERADKSIEEIQNAVSSKLGHVPSSSVRSYLRLNTPDVFSRTTRGRYSPRRKRPNKEPLLNRSSSTI